MICRAKYFSARPFDESDALDNLPKAVAAERKLKLTTDAAVEGVTRRDTTGLKSRLRGSI